MFCPSKIISIKIVDLALFISAFSRYLCVLNGLTHNAARNRLFLVVEFSETEHSAIISKLLYVQNTINSVSVKTDIKFVL